jgi:hypothetical protein
LNDVAHGPHQPTGRIHLYDNELRTRRFGILDSAQHILGRGDANTAFDFNYNDVAVGLSRNSGNGENCCNENRNDSHMPVIAAFAALMAPS